MLLNLKPSKKPCQLYLKDIEGRLFISLAWTTTPWTLPSNTALTVGKKIDYVLVKTFNQYTFEPSQVILAKNLVDRQFSGKFENVATVQELSSYEEGAKKIPYIILKEFKGVEILESRYEQLMPFTLPHDHPENAFRVIPGDFVTTLKTEQELFIQLQRLEQMMRWLQNK